MRENWLFYLDTLMKVDTYNIEGKKVGTTDMPDRLFGVPWKPELVKQVYDGERANARKPWAHAKGRGEVRGGGKKPWRQKGTGRARHGSIRSPLWVGGGRAHGPDKNRTYTVKINKKMKRGALFSLFSKKLKDKEVFMLDTFALKESKTKVAYATLKNLRDHASVYRIGIKGGKTVVAVPKNKSITKSLRNLPFVSYAEPRNINTRALLENKYIIFDAGSIKELKETYGA